MKKVILSAIAVIGLMTMSFTSSTEAGVKVVEGEIGDLQELETLSAIGFDTTDQISTTFQDDAVNTVYTKHTDPTDPKLPDEFSNKLNSVLAKY